MCGRILGTGPGAVHDAVPGTFSGPRPGGEDANEKQFACQSCTYQMCAVFLGSIRRPDLPVADIGNPNKCQCKQNEGSLQDKLVDITSLW